MSDCKEFNVIKEVERIKNILWFMVISGDMTPWVANRVSGMLSEEFESQPDPRPPIKNNIY